MSSDSKKFNENTHNDGVSNSIKHSTPTGAGFQWSPSGAALYESAPKPGGIYRVHSGGLNDFNADIDYCVKIGADGSVEGAWLEWLATKKDDSGRVTEARWANHRQRGALEADGYDVERAKAPKVIGLSDVCGSRAGSLVFVTGNPYLHWALRSSRGMTAVMPHLGYAFDDPDTNSFFKGRIPVFLSEGDRERCQTNAERLLAGGYVGKAYCLDIPERLRGRGLFDVFGFDEAASGDDLWSWLTVFRRLFEPGGEFAEERYEEVENPKDGKDGPAVLEGAVDLILNKDGSVKPLSENVIRIIDATPELSGFYLDTFKQKVIVTEHLPWIKRWGDEKDESEDELPREWGDQDDRGLRWYLSVFYGIKSAAVVDEGWGMSLIHRKRHPVREYLNSLEWDGTPRLDTLLIDYFGADDNVYTREATRKQIVASVARIFSPGVKKDEMLILVGEQGTGKSTFIRTLCKSDGKGKDTDRDWFTDSVTEFGDNKDEYLIMTGKLMVEAGELDGFNRKNEKRIKSFLSKREDQFRAPYERRDCSHKRQCVFWGTTNEATFLNDPTGGRRFWPVEGNPERASKDIWDDLPGEVDQIWAEAVTLYREGESLLLSPEAKKMAFAEQKSRFEEDSRKGAIEEWIKKPVWPDWRMTRRKEHMMFWEQGAAGSHELVRRDYVCAAEILYELFGERSFRANSHNTKEINKILNTIPFLERTGQVMFRDYGKLTAYKVNLPPYNPDAGDDENAQAPSDSNWLERDSEIERDSGNGKPPAPRQQSMYGENDPYFRD